ncbi:integral membrane protein [Streptococcus pneumoniae]|nr:integral membrane protein [Streptococcus pneumoniae]CIW07749.1 integral membrane protein [Streptococcus pneumoniae]
MLSWLARVIKGIVIALGFILPGIFPLDVYW